MATSVFEDMLSKVRALLAKADATEFPEEARILREKAEALQFKYKISIATAPEAERRAAHGFTPVWRDVFVCSYGNEFSSYYTGIAGQLVRHVDAKAVTLRKVVDGKAQVFIRVVGFSHDLDYLELLLVGATLAFGKRMEPRKDANESDATNAYRLRMGGMERHRIAHELFGPIDDAAAWQYGYNSNGRYVRTPSNEFKARTRRVTKLIKDGAAAAGENAGDVLGQGNNIKTYRDSYAQGFYYTLQNRLRNMAASRSEDEKGLVLKSLAAQVDEEFYGAYPHLAPSTEVAQAWVDPSADCAKCQKAAGGYCREHMYLKPSTAKVKDTPFNHGAFNAGGHAARTVDLGAGGTPKAPAGATRTQLG